MGGAYRKSVSTQGSSKAIAVARYTLLRLGLFAVVWLLLELVTPLSLGWTLVAAILMSGAVSIIVLDRSRGDAARAMGGVFERINARIEASASAEDVDDSDLADGDRDSHDQAVDQQEQTGGLQGGHEGGSGGSREDDSQRTERP